MPRALELCAALVFQTPGIHVHWSDTEDDPTHATVEWAADAVFSPALELFAIGTQCSPCRAEARKYDAAGNVVWSRTLEWGPPSSDSDGLLIARGPDGHVVVAGSIDDAVSSTRRDIVVTKLDSANGTNRWKSFVRLDGRAHDDDVPTQILIDAAGDVYLAAELHDFGPFHLADIGLYKLSARNGRVLWHTRLRSTAGGPGLNLDDRFARMALTSNGWLLVAGTLYTGAFGGGLPYFGTPLLFALDGAAGIARPIPLPVPLSNVTLADLVVEPLTNQVVLAGTTYSGSDLDLFVAKLSANWNLAWYSSFAPAGVAHEVLRSADVAPNGDVVVVGTSNGAANMQWCTFRYHFTAQPPPGALVFPVWARYFQAGPQADGPDQPLDVRIDQAGNASIAGIAEAAPGGPHRMVDLRYSAGGVQLAGTPVYANAWNGANRDVVAGRAFDPQSGASAFAGFIGVIESGSPAVLTDWAICRTGP